MPHYIMKEMPDLQGTGETTTYPQMVLTGQTDTEQLVRRIAARCTFSPGEIKGVIGELADALAVEMGAGHSVKIDGLGVFTPSLALLPGRERELPQAGKEEATAADKDTARRNARSIRVGGVNFRTDKALVRETDKWCELQRAPWKPARSSKRYTPGQRLELARQYLEEHPLLTVSTYQRLTGLLRSAATKELRQWGHTPGTGIGISGSGSHRVYVKADEGTRGEGATAADGE